MSKCLVVLSGGQDSATCAAWAASEFEEVYFITFDYNQRHKKELLAAYNIARIFGGRHVVYKVPVLADSDSALTKPDQSVNDTKNGLPKTFVPGRNLIFLTQAASYAISNGISDVVTGVCQTDYSGYPDCREDTILALEQAIQLGNENLLPNGFRIHTPLMHKTKAETVDMAFKLKKGWDALLYSWTCYEGGDKPCGVCPACKLRAKGFEEAGKKDPLIEVQYVDGK